MEANYSTWPGPVVNVKKTIGFVLLCAQFFTGPNAVLKEHQYPLSTLDLYCKLNWGNIFKNRLVWSPSPGSSKLVGGLFQYNRLPFGVKHLPFLFQHWPVWMMWSWVIFRQNICKIWTKSESGSNSLVSYYTLRSVLFSFQAYSFLYSPEMKTDIVEVPNDVARGKANDRLTY